MSDVYKQEKGTVEVTTLSPDCQQWINRGLIEMFGFNTELYSSEWSREKMSDAYEKEKGTVKVTTESPDCQQWINRGLIEMFGFNSEEAGRCFTKALAFDNDCAMAYYFLAHTCAADYNNPNGLDYETGYHKARRALELANESSSLHDWEKSLIEAAMERFCWPLDEKPLSERNRAYVDAMRPVYHKFGGESSLVTALFAESIMQLAPWQLWTPPPNVKPAIPETEELVTVLEAGLKRDPKHPALCHLYIHTMELSATPEKALPAADALRNDGPQHGHLLHMPSHIDMWVGQYKEAVETNQIAVEADEKYRRESGQENEFYKMYRMHNYHFVVWAAMFDGQFATAMEYAEAACKQLDPEAVTFMLGDFQMGATYFEGFASLPWHVLIRFGKWEDIIARPMKEDKNVYPGVIAMSHYARGIAFAALGRFEDADIECRQFRNNLKNESLTKRFVHNNVMHDPKNRKGILDIAEEVLDGEVEYHKGNIDKAFEHLRLAVKRDVELKYDEPWGWMMPVRHVLGALLLEQGRAAEAETVYREDLVQYKDNMWSLLGLQQALKQQGKVDEAEAISEPLKKVRARSDVKIGASCLCAKKLCCQ